MKVVLLQEAIAVASRGHLDQPARDEQLDRVAGSHGRTVGERCVRHERLLVIRSEVEAARHGNGDGDRLAGIESAGSQAELRPSTAAARRLATRAGPP